MLMVQNFKVMRNRTFAIKRPEAGDQSPIGYITLDQDGYISGRFHERDLLEKVLDGRVQIDIEPVIMEVPF